MPERICALTGCGRHFVPKNGQHRYCTPVHRLRANARSNRGKARYGHSHQEIRRQLERQVASGIVTCARCGDPIIPGEPWDLDHDDNGGGYLGPSHRACNRATAEPETYEDNPAEGIFWGPPDPEGGRPTRWSRAW